MIDQKLLDLLKEKDVAAAYKIGNKYHVLHGKMIKPLVELYCSNVNLKNAIFADKIVGCAAASFFIVMCVKHVYGAVMSMPAYVLLVQHGINVSYGELVSDILNQDRSRLCPMEEIALFSNRNPFATVTSILSKLKM